MNKNAVKQYFYIKGEVDDLKGRIFRLKNSIAKIDEDIQQMEEENYMVVDRVKGGEGGNVPFKIEGFPYPEYDKARSKRLQKKILLNHHLENLEEREIELEKTANDVENFIKTIQDAHIRRVVGLRIIDNMSFRQIADRIGGGNSEDGVKMMFHRFLDKEFSEK